MDAGQSRRATAEATEISPVSPVVLANANCETSASDSIQVDPLVKATPADGLENGMWMMRRCALRWCLRGGGVV